MKQLKNIHTCPNAEKVKETVTRLPQKPRRKMGPGPGAAGRVETAKAPQETMWTRRQPFISFSSHSLFSLPIFKHRCYLTKMSLSGMILNLFLNNAATRGSGRRWGCARSWSLLNRHLGCDIAFCPCGVYFLSFYNTKLKNIYLLF